MNVEIWSDVVCPWCYIGKRNFERALGLFDHRDEVTVAWRSFELDPAAPPAREGTYARRLGSKYGVGPTEAQAMIDRMTGAAARAGLAFRLADLRSGNTFDAHRVLHLAASRGLQAQLEERFLAATFTEGEPIGDPDVLARLAADVGLGEKEIREVLDTDAFGAAVRADEARAAELGISGVPFFVVDGHFAISGAQPADAIAAVLDRAWSKGRTASLAGTGEGPDGRGNVAAR